MAIEQILYNCVNHIGETQNEAYQIIETTEDPEYAFEDDRSYKVYHSEGFCFDVSKKTVFDEETGDKIGIEYHVYDEWEGFERASIRYYIKLLG